MSFQNQNIWNPSSCENSERNGLKRTHPWFQNTSEPELFSNKRPAIESVKAIIPTSGTPSAFTEHRLFGSDVFQNSSLGTRSIPSMSAPYNTSGNASSAGPSSFNKGDGTFRLMGQSYSHAERMKSKMPSYTNNFMTLSSLCKANENFTPAGPSASAVPHFGNRNTGAVPINAVYNAGDGSGPSARQKDYVERVANPVLSDPASFGLKKNKEKKVAKKVSPNNFPANVKSLLSTGMFDGVPVKYVSWSREKSLRGIIKGTGYLCDCKECGLAVALNAYEFERHAGCKTKHPNNHIYFQNGKTVYGVVQELKTTPQDKLFDAILTVTGSIINMRNFNTWKGSFRAATVELQRIYGREEVPMPK